MYVAPAGDIEDDPNFPDKKFPENRTQSYRSLEPLPGVGEVGAWDAYAQERLRKMKRFLGDLEAMDITASAYVGPDA
jgi:hypothetical protein